jgi:hypothetical protein
MNVLPLLTVGNIMLAWDIYNYYVVFNTMYNGVYYSGKAIKISYSLFQKLYPYNKNKNMYQMLEVENECVLIKDKNIPVISVNNEKDWNIIDINK